MIKSDCHMHIVLLFGILGPDCNPTNDLQESRMDLHMKNGKEGKI